MIDENISHFASDHTQGPYVSTRSFISSLFCVALGKDSKCFVFNDVRGGFLHGYDNKLMHGIIVSYDMLFKSTS